MMSFQKAENGFLSYLALTDRNKNLQINEIKMEKTIKMDSIPRGKMKPKKVLMILINIILLILLSIIVFILSLCHRDWLYPNTYSDNVTDVIRFLSLFEILISTFLVSLNKTKTVTAVLIICNLFTFYKFISTFIIL